MTFCKCLVKLRRKKYCFYPKSYYIIFWNKKINSIKLLFTNFSQPKNWTYFLQNFFLNINRIGIYLIWVKIKSRKAELKQRDKVSLTKTLACFVMIVDALYNLFSQTQNHVFLEFQKIKAFKILHRGFQILASSSNVFPT